MTTKTKTGQQPISTAILMQSLKFNSRDLSYNRDGQISPRQQGRLQPPRVQGLVMWVLLGHVALIIGVLGLVAVATGQWVLLLIALFAGGMSGMPIVMIRDQKFMKPELAKDVEQGTVKSVCGDTLRYPREGTSNYIIAIGDTTFDVSSQVYSGFHQAGTYCIYYLPRSRVILSAERID